MIDRHATNQRPDEVVDIADWPFHEDYEVFPIGARDKTLRVCPAPSPYPFCLPGHKYLFKESMKSVRNPQQFRHPEQYWSEVIAFKIGRLMKVPVPPVFVAVNSETGTPGALIEWFVGYDPSARERFTPGGDHMQASIEGYDRDRGAQHNLLTILTLCRALGVQDWQEYWALCLCFDALIGNTDRHQENWGLIWGSGEGEVRIAPFFDNGTSLGHELQHAKFVNLKKDINRLKAYVNRGKHHMKWHQSDAQRLRLMSGVIRYCRKYPRMISLLQHRLSWGATDLDEMLGALTAFDIEWPLTSERAAFIYQLTEYRRRLLLDLLGKLENEVHTASDRT